MKHIAIFLPLAALCLAQAQDLPDGKGKNLVENSCAACHGLDVVVSQRATRQGWATIVDYMVSRGASGTPEEIQTMVDYLAKNFPPLPEKINVNKAAARDLAASLDLTAGQAEAIVKYRADHGDFKDFDGLAKVQGVDAKKLEAKKDHIVF